MYVESDKRVTRGEVRGDQIGCDKLWRRDVGRKRKWGWPTGTRVICSVLTEHGFGIKTLHGSGSQTQVRDQRQTQATMLRQTKRSR